MYFNTYNINCENPDPTAHQRSKLVLKRQRLFSTVRGGDWTAEVAHSLGRHLLMRHLLGCNFLHSETAFCRPRPWLRFATAAGTRFLYPFYIFLYDSNHGHDANTKFPSKLKVDADESFWWYGFIYFIFTANTMTDNYLLRMSYIDMITDNLTI